MFEIRTIADATMEAIEPSQVTNSASLRAPAWKAVRVLVCCMALLAVLLGGARQAQAQVTVAGVQSEIAAGTWTGPVGVATDSGGNIYVALYSVGPIMKINAGTHAVSTFLTTAGGTPLLNPQQIAIDSSNKLYIADQGNNRVVVCTIGAATCTVTATYNVTAPFAVAAAPSGDIWVGANTEAFRIPSGSASGTTFNIAAITLPAGSQIWGITFASIGGGINDLYLSDNTSGNIYKYTAASSYNPASQTTFVSGLNTPGGLFFDSSNNLIVAESTPNSVIKLLSPGYSVATSLVLSNSVPGAESVAQDNNGNLFLTAFNLGTLNAGVVTEISTQAASFGNQSVGTTSAAFSFNFDVAAGTNIGSINVLDQGTSGLEFNYQGAGSTCTTGVYASATLCTVMATFTPARPGLRLGAVQILSNTGIVLATAYVGGTGVGPQINFLPGAETLVGVTGSTHLVGVAVDAAGNVYAGDSALWQVHQVEPGGPTHLVENLSGNSVVPQNLAVDGAGNVLVTDPNNGKLWTVPPGATLHTFGSAVVLTSALTQPRGVAVDGGGNIYIADASGILKMSRTAAGGYTAPSPISTITPLMSPYGIQVDGAGNLFIADFAGNRVVVKFATGSETVVQTNLNTPTSLAVDVNGNIYIANSGDSNILRAPQTAPGVWGTPTAVATTTTLSTGLNGVALDGSGNLYVTDAGVTQVIEKQYTTALPYTFVTATPIGNDYAGGPANFTVINFGNAPLTAVAPGLTPATDFPQSGGTCTSAFSLAANGNCTLNITFHPLSVGAHPNELFTLTDNNLGVSPSTQTITLSGTGSQTSTTTTTTLTTGTNPANYGTALTFTATVRGVTGLASPTGTVTFSVDGGAMACTNPPGTLSATTPGEAAATCNISTLTGISHTITTTYVPGADLNYTGSTAAQFTQNVNPLATTLALVSSQPVSSSVNQSVLFTATVTATAPPAPPALLPTGTVTFTLDTNPIAACTTVTMVSGVASCPIQNMTAASHVIRATYNPDTNYTAPAVKLLTQTVNALNPTVGVTPSPASPSSLNTNVTFTASLTGTTLTPVLPTGTMTFALNGATVASCTGAVNASGVKTCAIQNMPAGSNTVTAAYSGDTNFVQPTAGSASYSTTPLAGTLTITAAPGSSVATGTPVTFTATMTASSVAPVVPNGWVTWTINGNPVQECPTTQVNASQKATCTTSSLVVPADLISATYSVDNNYTVAAPATFTETVGKTAANTALTSSLPSSSINQQVTFTATVTPPSGSVKPTGTVTFTQGATTLCAAVGINSNTGVANCSYAFTSLSAGATITATYSGDQNFSSGTAATTSQVVVASGTTTTLSSVPNPSATNQQVAFTAVLTPNYNTGTAKPTGTVTFTNTSTTPATTLCAALTIVNGIVPICNYTFTSAGTNNVVATYTTGDTNFTGSASAAVVQAVGAGATTVVLTSAPSSSSVNQQVTFSATINTNSGTTFPQGTMTYTDTSTAPTTLLCTVTLSSNGNVPACTYAFLAPGTHTVIAAFTSSDSNFSDGASSARSEVVNATSTTTSVSSSPSSSSVNQSVTFTAIVTPAYTGTVKPTGTVTFTNTSTTPATTLCAALTIANGIVPVCNYTFTAPGSNNVVATYTSGDTNFTNSVSAADIHSVGSTTTTTGVLAAPSPSAVNQPVTFTATVTPSVTGTTNPGGGVIFSYTLTGGASGSLCAGTSKSVSTSAGVTTAVCQDSLPTPGAYTITAAYSGDANFAASSGQVAQTVNVDSLVVTVTSLPSPVVVNQQVTFNAAVAPTFQGATPPTGTVTFTDTSTNTPLCSGVTLAAGTASCHYSQLTGGTHAIVASYSGDINYSSAQSPVFSQLINPTTTVLSLTSSSPVVVATQLVTFTATVTPSVTGTFYPSGTISFSSLPDGAVSATAGCQAVNVSPVPGTGTVTAMCTALFPASTVSSSQTISAVFVPSDTNFLSATGSGPQTVQNFAIATALTPAPTVNPGTVTLTQGYSNVTEPFAATTVTLKVTSTGAFADSLDVTCQVTNSAGATVVDPACTPSTTTMSGTTNTALTYTLSASPTAIVGAYSVALVAKDHSTPALFHPALPISVYVIAKANLLTLAQGASGTETATFNTSILPAGTLPFSPVTFACGTVWNTDTKTVISAGSLGGLTCTGDSASWIAGNPTSTAKVTIATNGTIAQLQRSSTIYAAAFLGLPLLVLMGWVGGRKSPRRSLFRFIGLILVMIGVSYATGCGGKFTYPPVTGGTGIATGNYLVQVVATDSHGNKFYAAIPLGVSSNSVNK